MKKVLFIVFILFYSSFGNSTAYWGWDYNFNVACDEHGDGGGSCYLDIGTYHFYTWRGYGADYVLLVGKQVFMQQIRQFLNNFIDKIHNSIKDRIPTGYQNYIVHDIDVSITDIIFDEEEDSWGNTHKLAQIYLGTYFYLYDQGSSSYNRTRYKVTLVLEVELEAGIDNTNKPYVQIKKPYYTVNTSRDFIWVGGVDRSTNCGISYTSCVTSENICKTIFDGISSIKDFLKEEIHLSGGIPISDTLDKITNTLVSDEFGGYHYRWIHIFFDRTRNTIGFAVDYDIIGLSDTDDLLEMNYPEREFTNYENGYFSTYSLNPYDIRIFVSYKSIMSKILMDRLIYPSCCIETYYPEKMNDNIKKDNFKILHEDSGDIFHVLRLFWGEDAVYIDGDGVIKGEIEIPFDGTIGLSCDVEFQYKCEHGKSECEKVDYSFKNELCKLIDDALVLRFLGIGPELIWLGVQGIWDNIVFDIITTAFGVDTSIPIENVNSGNFGCTVGKNEWFCIRKAGEENSKMGREIRLTMERITNYNKIIDLCKNFPFMDFEKCCGEYGLTVDECINGLDYDNDGITNKYDNCVSVKNPNQFDTDGDGVGDECDDDIDGDSVLNSKDIQMWNYYLAIDRDMDGYADELNCKSGEDRNKCRENCLYNCREFYYKSLCRPAGSIDNYTYDPNICAMKCRMIDNCSVNVFIDILRDKGVSNLQRAIDYFYTSCPLYGGYRCRDLFSNPAQSDMDGDGIGDTCDMDENSYYNIEMSQSPKIDYKEEICSLSENFNIIGKKVNKIYDTVADLSVSADLRKSYKNRETGLEFDFNNDSFDKFEIGIIPEDVTIGVCWCILDNGSDINECRMQCPLFKDNGEPIDFKNGSKRRYYNPITTYADGKGDDICNEYMSPPINYAGYTQACLKKAYPKKVYYGISQYGGNYRWDFSYFPVVEELVMNGWSNVSKGIDIASFIINTPEDDGKYSQIRIATTRNAKGEYQKFGIDGCRFGEKNCTGRWHKLYDKIEEGCVPLIPDMRDIGNCPITGGECPWELDKTAVIDFGSRFGSRMYWDLPPDKIGIKFDRRVIMMFDTKDGGVTDGKFVGIYNPVSGKIERLFDSKVGNTVYPPNGLKRYSLSVGYSSLSRLGISSDDRVREIMFVYGGEINGRLDNTLYVGWFDDEGVRWRSVYFDSYVPMLGIYVPMPKAKDAYVGYDEVRNMIFIGDGVGENIFGEFGEMREDWIVGIWSYQFGSREGTVDFWRILPEQREIGEDNWDIDAAQIYDSERGKWVLFGGVGRDGVMDWIWEMDTGDYYGRVIEGGMSGGPGRRAGMAIYYDRTYRRVYLMGGYDELGRLHNDIWEYDMRTGLWREVVGDRGEIPRVKGGTIYYSPEKGIFSYYGGKYEGEGMGGIFYYDERYGRWYIPKINPWMNVAYLNNMEYLESTYTKESKEDIRVAVSGEDSVSPEVVMLKMEEGSGKIGVEVRDRVMREVIGYGKRSSPEEYVSVWGVNGDVYDVRIKRREGYSEGEVYNYRLSSKRVEISDKAVDKIKEKGIKKILRDGDYLYVLSFEDGLSVYDISDAKNPERIWNNKVLTIGSDMEVLEDYLYVVVPAGLMVIDKRGKRNLSVVGYERLIGYSRELEIAGDYAYVTGGVFGVFVVNISDRRNPKWEDTRLKFEDVYEEIEVKGDKIILGGKIKGDVQIYRDNGMDFEYVGKVDRRGEVKGMVVRGERMYLRYSNRDGYEVYRIKVAGDPEYLGKYEIKKGDVDRIRGEYIGKYYYGIERNGKGIKIYELK